MTAARLAKTVAEPTAKNSFIFTILGTKWGILWLWLLIINVVAFLAYGGDKLLAKLKEHQPKVPRLPEKNLLLLAMVELPFSQLLKNSVILAFVKIKRTFPALLLWLALVGGGVGAWLGMELFRHKTQHRAFRICVPLFTLIWIVVVGGLYLYFNVIR